MAETKTKVETKSVKKKNNAVEFWRFIFTIAVAFGHFNSFTWAAKIPAEDLIMTGGRVLGLFLFLSGYFMMVSFKRKQAKKETEKEAPGKQAWKYTGKRWLGLYPAMLGGVVLAFIVRNWIAGTPLSKIPSLLAGSLFEFLGLYQLGLVGYNEQKSTEQLLEFINEGNVSPLWNGPLWYISAILIVSVIIYYVLAKNEDFFIAFFCPIVIIGSYGFSMLNQGAAFLRTTTGWLGIPNNLLRVAAGICVGCLMYYVVEYLKKKEFSKKLTVTFTILNALLIAFFIYTIWNGIAWNEFANNAFIIPFTIIMLVQKDLISKLLDNGVSAYLGKLSLYFYCCHIVFVFLLPYLFPDMSYITMAIAFVVACFIWSNVMMLFDDFVVTPLIRNKLKKALN